jgi:signal peptidase II
VRGLRGQAPLTPRAAALLTAGTVILVDQLTKWWAVSWLRDHPIRWFGGVLELHYLTNPGAAFSILQGSGAFIALVAIALAVFIVLIVSQVDRRAEAIALGLILGGALGNLADRLFRGGGILDGRVVDWFDLSFFPAFNAADSAITIGAVVAVLVAFRHE